MENQCLGLAETMGADPEVKRIAVRNPWRSLPPQLWLRPFQALSDTSDPLQPPWPDLLIATGRQTVALSTAIRKASEGRTFSVQIQNPVVTPSNFDMVVAPQHDRLRGHNVIETFGALNRVSAAAIATAAERFSGGVSHLPRPLIVVLLGGDNKVYRMTEASCRDLAAKLRNLCESSGAGLAVTPSRRTGAVNEKIIRDALADLPHVWHEEGQPNPYLGWMGLGDAFVVTSDSVNMVSEACGTGKPVFVHDLPGGNAKFERFHQALREAHMVRPLDGQLAHWTYPVLDDTAKVAAIVKQRFAEHLQKLERPRT
ncbi:mitochondrial fission ELM1 family protein [Minwuia sp.]|uniref:mitochondrial fission ELM1 family protein n=1 Tax=Minwuia sp. TaxID=2493630 RepID=UPI003A8F416E